MIIKHLTTYSKKVTKIVISVNLKKISYFNLFTFSKVDLISYLKKKNETPPSLKSNFYI